MKTRLTLLSCVFLLFAGVANAQVPEPSQWKRYTVKGEEFSVTLPTLPGMVINKIFQPRLNKQRRERVLVTAAGGVVYSIYACENPKPRQSLEEFVAEQTPGLDLSTERVLNISGLPGKEYSSRDGTKPTTEQFFATEQRLYRFVVSGAGADHAGAKQFLSSITFGKKQEGIQVSEGPGLPLESGVVDKIYVGREVDRKARLIKKPEPSYTEAARGNEIIGTVVLKVVFSASGQVTNIRTVQGLPYGLTERAIAAARKIKFIPAMKDGRYVSMWMQLEYNFNLY